MHKHARDIYDAAIAAVQPEKLINHHLKMEGDVLFAGDGEYTLVPGGRIFLLSVGKAAASMSLAAEKILGDKVADGLVLTKYDHGLPHPKFRQIEAGHPVPDENSRKGAEAITSLAKKSGKDDIFLLLLSGGASALMGDLSPDIDRDQFEEMTRRLLKSGADIKELNTVRKHLSFLKGGQLARLVSPGRTICLALSDVPGDAPDIIGSGPTVADTSSWYDAVSVLKKYKLWDGAGNSITKRLQDGLEGRIQDTPKPGDDELQHSYFSVIGNNRMAVNAAAEKAFAFGYHTVVLEEEMKGEAADQAISILERCLSWDGRLPVCFIAGGETTVTVTGTGKGGRNQQMALAAIAYAFQNEAAQSKQWLYLAGATDGTDGPTDASGAIADTDLVNRLKESGADVHTALENNDAYSFFKKHGGLLMTGPTLTNVMDLLIVLRTI